MVARIWVDQYRLLNIFRLLDYSLLLSIIEIIEIIEIIAENILFISRYSINS